MAGMSQRDGLSLAAFRARRYRVDDARLGRLLCPPYDVIDDDERARLLTADADNAVSIIAAMGDGTGPAYDHAAARLDAMIDSGLLGVDDAPTLYVYEMATPDGARTRGLVGAVELRESTDGVILPHENTMAGPVADRLALMSATDADLEPIYLVYDGGGTASDVVAGVDATRPIAVATTPDGIVHRLWALVDPRIHAAVDADLRSRRALIADGHHRYATYLELQRRRRAERGPGPWDRGLTLLVDSTAYGPQVHAIHRVLASLALPAALALIEPVAHVDAVPDIAAGLERAAAEPGFAAVLSDGRSHVLVTHVADSIRSAAIVEGEPAAMAELDVTVLHRGLVGPVWGLTDDVESVRYAHSVEEALSVAMHTNGTAVLLRPTPVDAVAAVAAQGGRMPRKSTLFTPKPASGLVIRRFADEVSG